MLHWLRDSDRLVQLIQYLVIGSDPMCELKTLTQSQSRFKMRKDVSCSRYSFVGALFVVFLQPFVHYVPLEGPFNSLEWQIGPFGWFFGLLSMLAGVPVTAVNVLFSIRKSIKKVKLCNRSASLYALCSVVATLSFLALTASFLLGGLGS